MSGDVDEPPPQLVGFILGTDSEIEMTCSREELWRRRLATLASRFSKRV
jgi:hypothetical protein